jgi:phage host-nuclease inhibitor protein Gam
MDGANIAAWIGVGLMTFFSIGSSIYTLINTGRKRAKANGILEEQLNNLKATSEDCSSEIKKVSTAMGDMKEHCASVTATFKTQITNLQKEVNSQKE